LRNLIQIALVVDDLERALDAWCGVFGVPRPDVRVSPARPNPDESYRGEPAAYGLKVAVIDCADRGFMIELHEPDENPSTFREFLDAHGNGVHHLGFQVGDARDDVVEKLQSRGFPVRTVGVYPGGSWTIIDGEDSLGVNLNIKPRP
jgi:catechol 2,3-dioxygenase-like lactoylglutathione lyase family enzyme